MLELALRVGFLLPQAHRLPGWLWVFPPWAAPQISTLAPPDPLHQVPKAWEAKTFFQSSKHLSSDSSHQQGWALDLLLKTGI